MKFLIGTFLWALALIAVCEKVDVYRTGYAIEQLRVEKKQSQHEQRALELELARVTAPEQIERVALTKLGMIRPRYDQVVLVGPRPKPLSPPSQGVLPVAHFAAQ
jgi:cell division protein FtsL